MDEAIPQVGSGRKRARGGGGCAPEATSASMSLKSVSVGAVTADGFAFRKRTRKTAANNNNNLENDGGASANDDEAKKSTVFDFSEVAAVDVASTFRKKSAVRKTPALAHSYPPPNAIADDGALVEKILKEVAGVSQGTDEFGALVERIVEAELVVAEPAIKSRKDLQEIILQVSAAFLQKVHKVADAARSADMDARERGPLVVRNERNTENRQLLNTLEQMKEDYTVELNKWNAVEEARLKDAERFLQLAAAREEEGACGESAAVSAVELEGLGLTDAEMKDKVDTAVSQTVERVLHQASSVRENINQLRQAVDKATSKQAELVGEFEKAKFGNMIHFEKPKALLQTLAARKDRIQKEAPRNLIRSLASASTPTKSIDSRSRGGTAKALIRALAAPTPDAAGDQDHDGDV